MDAELQIISDRCKMLEGDQFLQGYPSIFDMPSFDGVRRISVLYQNGTLLVESTSMVALKKSLADNVDPDGIDPIKCKIEEFEGVLVEISRKSTLTKLLGPILGQEYRDKAISVLEKMVAHGL
jgi:hypothetical protein